MAFAYSCLFVTVWGISILAVPGTLLLFGYSVSWAIPHAHNTTEPDTLEAHVTQYAIGFVFTALLLFFVLYTRYWPRVKHQIRAGVFPLSLCDRMPTTEAEFILACREAAKKGTLRVVSHGWSFYLAKMRATGNRVWTLKYTGMKANGSWKSGTTISEVKKELAKKKLTLASSPTMEYASLGSWISTCSHGHPGTDTVGIDWVKSARVLDVATGDIAVDGPVELLAKFGTLELEGQHVVLDVKLNTVKNVMLERFARVINTTESATWWMEGTHVRIMFIGTAGPLGIVWNGPTNDIEGKEMHPHCGGAFCFWFTVDCLPTLPCAWLGNLRRFDGVGTLDTANSTINPPFYPIFSIWGQLCCVYNLELFVPWSPNATQLASVVADIYAFHRKYYGRTELRMDRTTIYFDISLRSISKFELYFGMLKMRHGVTNAAQHLGKFRLQSLAPLKEISSAAAIRPVKSA